MVRLPWRFRTHDHRSGRLPEADRIGRDRRGTGKMVGLAGEQNKVDLQTIPTARERAAAYGWSETGRSGPGMGQLGALAEEHNLLLQLHAELLAHATLHLFGQLEHLGGRRAPGVDDDVRVFREHHRVTDPEAAAIAF